MIHGEIGSVSRERLAGFYKVCAELGIRVKEGYVREGLFADPENCVEIIHKMMQMEDRPTCILCPDDYSCLGAMLALESEGIHVPDDISLIGFDGINIGQLIEPKLTTYRQDVRKIAEEAINMLMDAIENPDDHQFRQVTVEGELIEGNTLAPI